MALKFFHSRRGSRRPLAVSPAGAAAAKAPPEKSSLLDKGVLLAIVVAAGALLALVVGLLLRRFDSKQQLIVNDFLVTAPGGATVSGDLGKEVADLFANDLNDIIQGGSSYSGIGYSTSGKYRQTPPFDGVPRVPVSKSYGLQIEGVSVDEILKIWNDVRYDQQVISGDILPTKSKTPEYVLQISLRTDEAGYHWTSQPFAASHDEMASEVRRVAEAFVKDTNPEIAGCYFLSLTPPDYADAVETFTEWLKREPQRAEPNLYLAKTFIQQGNYAGAKVFAERAAAAVPLAARGIRQRLRVSAAMAGATALWGTGDKKDAEQQFKSPLLANQPYASNQLGLLYLEQQKYAAAEETLIDVLRRAPQDFGAQMILGQTYAAENRNAAASQAFAKALTIKPTNSDAAVWWLTSLHGSNQDEQGAEYCRAWVGAGVGTATRSKSVIREDTRDLSLFCAQAEEGSGKPNGDALKLDYARTLTLPEGEAPGEITLYSNMVMRMPPVLCATGQDASDVAAEERVEVASAMKVLTGEVRKRAAVDPRAPALAAQCEAAEKTLEAARR